MSKQTYAPKAVRMMAIPLNIPWMSTPGQIDPVFSYVQAKTRPVIKFTGKVLKVGMCTIIKIKELIMSPPRIPNLLLKKR